MAIAVPSWVSAALRQASRIVTDVESPQTYALLRIGLGALVIANISTLWPLLEYLYSDHGMVPAARVCGRGMANLSILCHLPPDWGPQAFLVGFTAIATAFTLGLATRITGVLTVLLYASLWWRTTYVSWAGEHFFADFLFILCFARCGEAYSIDRWLRGRRATPWTPVPSWPRYLLILQVALCLGVNGWAKWGEEWRSGEALNYVFANDRFHRFPPWTLLHTLGATLLRGLTYVAWLTERCFPLVVLGLVVRPWLRQAGAPGAVLRIADWLLGRRLWAPLAIALLLGITTLLNVGWFVPATAVAVLCLFRGDELGRLPGARALGPATPRKPWRLIAAGVFALWHGWVITTRAIVPLVGETVAEPIVSAMLGYQRLTGTNQYWRMFSPGVPRHSFLLRVVVTTADGKSVDTWSDLDLLDHGRRINLPYDRRQKIHAAMTERNNGKLRRAHARWVCHRWRDAAGRPPVEVVLSRIDEPLISPHWSRYHGPVDPHEVATPPPREVELTTLRCDAP